MSLKVMVLESDHGVADAAIRQLADAGHEVLRCHEPGAAAFPCKGVAEKVTAPEFAPLKGLIDDVRELGGKFLVCSPCVKSRHIEDELVEEAEVVAAARFVTELSSAGTSLVY